MWLDKEASPAFQLELQSKGINFQLSLSGMHHRNAAECAIIKFKDHFIAGLYFPMQNSYHLLEQL